MAKINDIIALALVIFTLNQGSEIACNAVTKGNYYGNYRYADAHNSYDFSITSDQAWIVFQSCGESNDCREMNLYKFENEWKTISKHTDSTYIYNECGTLTVNNITSGEYRFTSASCIVSNYTLFMGCSNDTVTDANDEIESDISCDIIVSGIMQQTDKKYYKFDVLDTMDWISFDTCTDTNFHIHSLVIYTFGGRMKLMQSGVHYANCLKVNATNLSPGMYYISVNSEKEGKYTLGMQCSNNAGVVIADNYNEYSHDTPSKHHNITYIQIIAILLTVVALPLIGSFIFWKFWNRKLRKVANDVIYTQSVQHAAINDVEEADVTKNEDHTQLTEDDDEQELF